MTGSGKIHEEATVVSTGGVNAKTTTLFGFWNARTMSVRARQDGASHC